GYVALARLSTAEIIDLIHRSGGVAVVAHPKRLPSSVHLSDVCDLGADGLEVVHPSASEDSQRELRDFANRRALLTTGGTDFHEPCGRPIGVGFDAASIDALRRAAGMHVSSLTGSR
ncbi:MAG: hypothetical protein M3126_12685, partial [Candidatus Eremiobacteraeota bacterium]|nr:hypothetical protein [Candidatus Eremiobacteraeota bacterium]